MPDESAFELDQGIFIPRNRTSHRDEEYDAHGFDTLMRMQREHFWYVGRHRLLLNVLKKEFSRRMEPATDLRAIDLGGGCGGWIEYLHTHEPKLFQTLALGDSSLRALSLAGPIVGSFAQRYQIDLMNLPWNSEWDVAFLLDVLEHIPDHVEVLRQIIRSLRPGGLLFVTTPALNCFWTYNDDLVHHQRRYCRQDYRELAEQTGFQMLRSEYFMFLLSPVLVLSRLLFQPPVLTTPEEVHEYLAKTHRVPWRPINGLLTNIFLLEASVVNTVHFPWGTSILTVLQRPLD